MSPKSEPAAAAVSEALEAKKRKRAAHELGRSKSKRQKPQSGESLPNGTASCSPKAKLPPADVEPTAHGPASEGDLRNGVLVAQKKRQRRKKSKHHDAQMEQSQWRVSKPMGGRMSDIDPIFTQDEKYLILAYNTSIQVYSTSDSLLVRRISLPISDVSVKQNSGRPHIVATVLSPTNPGILYVAASDGRVWHVDWQKGSWDDAAHSGRTQAIADLAVSSVEFKKGPRDVLFISGQPTKATAQLIAYDSQTQKQKAVHAQKQEIQILRSLDKGRVIIACARHDILVGTLTSDTISAVEDLKYNFFSVGVDDQICCLDVHVAERPRTTKKKNREPALPTKINVAIGCARGAILVYNDILVGLQSPRSRVAALEPRKYHWHRKAVHSLKWSQDGKYLVSGGSENVLVLWLIEIGQPETLPHLPGTIENIVVSPLGSSYALHLGDNSTIVLSTADMRKPETYVSGLQSLAFHDTPRKESWVRRVVEEVEAISTPLLAKVNPADPSMVYLAIGNGQKSPFATDFISTPFLQQFDISSFQSIRKQALTRTHLTDVNVTPKGHPIVEPAVTLMAFSFDGTWLATVDEWQPPREDPNPVPAESYEQKSLARERKEVYLKFWQVGAQAEPLQLLSRIVSPHSTDCPDSVLAMASDKASSRFATLGSDAVVRLWVPKKRQHDGLGVSDAQGRPLTGWVCSQSITLGEIANLEEGLAMSGVQPGIETSGALAFSEDGSTLFIAFGGKNQSVAVVVDTERGDVRHVLHDLFTGTIRGLEVLSPHVIALSDELCVYNVVTDDVQYAISLDQLSPSAGRLTHLAVDFKSRTFAVALPCSKPKGSSLNKNAYSELAIFSPVEKEPRFFYRFPHLLTAVLSAVGTSGYLVVDALAQLCSVVEGASSDVLARSLADLNLDVAGIEEVPETTDDMAFLSGETGLESDDEGNGITADVNDEEEYDIHPATVAPSQLADIFNSAPAFAMPPIEQVFYQITKLFASKPLIAESAG